MITVPLDVCSTVPLYQQIYLGLRGGILEGSLPASTKLPSTRSLSDHLGVSRNTVESAYYQLQAEGYIDSAPKRGFFVCEINPVDYVKQGKGSIQSISSEAFVTSSPQQQFLYDFSPYAVDISHFPYSVWRKLSKQVLSEGQDLFLLGNNQGDGSLREAICRYVCFSREVRCVPEQIIVGAGVDYLLQMLSLLFTASGIHHVALENPGYMQAAHIFQNNGLTLCPGRLDEKGLVVESIPQDCQAVYVTPSHQYPLGAVMPFGRREELLEWAKKSPDRYIIEDDHDSEFRYKGKPIPSLQGMDGNSRVIYIGTFSKAIAPAIRVGYMILPRQMLPLYQRICGHYSCTVSRIDQEILTGFLSQGYFEKHVNRMRKIYREKHDLLLECLKPLTQKQMVRLHGEHAGLHVVMELPEKWTENTGEEILIQKAARAGIRLYGIGSHHLPHSQDWDKMQGILLGYSNLSLEEIEKGISLLTEVMIKDGNNTCNFWENRLT